MQLGKISSDDLLLLLNLYPTLSQQQKEARELLLQKSEKVFAKDCLRPLWCNLYELPVRVHIQQAIQFFGFEDALKNLASADNQIQALPGLLDTISNDLDQWEPDEDETQDLQQSLGVIYGVATSLINTLRCLETFGLYLNDLVAKVREEGVAADKWLFAAIKIDVTVMGCQTIMARITRAVMEDDQKFLSALRKAMTGKLTKREQKNYQQMRLALQVLLETGAPKLGQEDLYQLFVEELRLIRGESDDDEGNVANNLRQFAYQFMKQKSVS